MRTSARKSGLSRRLAAGAISPPLLCGSGFRVASLRDLDLKQRRQLGRGRRHRVRIRNLDVDQLLERGIQPDFGENPAPGPLPRPNLVPPEVYHVRNRGNGPAPGELSSAQRCPLWASSLRMRL